jgi:hypothetical protein
MLFNLLITSIEIYKQIIKQALMENDIIINPK